MAHSANSLPLPLPPKHRSSTNETIPRRLTLLSSSFVGAQRFYVVRSTGIGEALSSAPCALVIFVNRWLGRCLVAHLNHVSS